MVGTLRGLRFVVKRGEGALLEQKKQKRSLKEREEDLRCETDGNLV